MPPESLFLSYGVSLLVWVLMVKPSCSGDNLSRGDVPVPSSSCPPEAPKGWDKAGNKICQIFSALPHLLLSALAKLLAARQHPAPSWSGWHR